MRAQPCGARVVAPPGTARGRKGRSGACRGRVRTAGWGCHPTAPQPHTHIARAGVHAQPACGLSHLLAPAACLAVDAQLLSCAVVEANPIFLQQRGPSGAAVHQHSSVAAGGPGMHLHNRAEHMCGARLGGDAQRHPAEGALRDRAEPDTGSTLTPGGKLGAPPPWWLASGPPYGSPASAAAGSPPHGSRWAAASAAAPGWPGRGPRLQAAARRRSGACACGQCSP